MILKNISGDEIMIGDRCLIDGETIEVDDKLGQAMLDDPNGPDIVELEGTVEVPKKSKAKKSK